MHLLYTLQSVTVFRYNESMSATAHTPASHLYVRATIIVAVALSLGFSWLVIVAGALRPNIINILIQALVVAIIVSLFVVVIRRFRRTRTELQLARETAEKEAALLRKRSAFIYSSSSKLSQKLSVFEKAIAGLDPGDVHVGPLNKKTTELRTLLNRLNTISQLEANMALTSTATIDAAKLLNEAAEQYTAAFTSANARLQLAGPDSVLVDGDAQMLREVFVAIIDNAVKFMPAEAGLVDIVYSIRHKKLYITFTDNGAGIAADKLPELFQPFSRTDGVMTFNRQGQGLSLYISRLCVEIMGGHITLSSQEGSGTTVTIELPLAKKMVKRPRHHL